MSKPVCIVWMNEARVYEQALELKVIGTKRSPAPLAHIAKVYPPEATDEVLGASDFVLLLLPSTAETENFMDARRFLAGESLATLVDRAGILGKP